MFVICAWLSPSLALSVLLARSLYLYLAHASWQTLHFYLLQNFCWPFLPFFFWLFSFFSFFLVLQKFCDSLGISCSRSRDGKRESDRERAQKSFRSCPNLSAEKFAGLWSCCARELNANVDAVAPLVVLERGSGGGGRRDYALIDLSRNHWHRMWRK